MRLYCSVSVKGARQPVAPLPLLGDDLDLGGILGHGDELAPDIEARRQHRRDADLRIAAIILQIDKDERRIGLSIKAAGYDADFTIVDLKRRETITNAMIASRCGWTPYDVLTKALVAGMTIVGADFREPLAADFGAVAPPLGQVGARQQFAQLPLHLRIKRLGPQMLARYIQLYF